MWSIYVIQNDITNEKYVGFTSNLKKRIETHNGNGQKFTSKKKGKWVLVYSEIFRSKDDAINREKKLKQHGRAKQELFKRIENSFL